MPGDGRWRKTWTWGRLLLIGLIGLGYGGEAPQAEDRVTSRLNLYVDDDATTIISPMILLEKDIRPDTSLHARYIADIQSCASVDVVSSASPSLGYEETRHEITVGVQHRKKLLTLGGAFSFSTENDYVSRAILADVSQELFQRNFKASLGLSFRWDEIGRVNDEAFSQSLRGYGATVALTQLFTPFIVGQLVYFTEYLDGYQSSPYRFVPVGDDFSVPETHPEKRLRQSITGRLKESLTDRCSFEQSVRFYGDSWGIWAQTLLLQAYWDIASPFVMRLRYRFHNQSRADFYRRDYDRLQTYMSRDREIGTLRSHLVGPQLRYAREDLWSFREAAFDVKVEYFFIDYDDYALLDNKEGILFSTGFHLLY